MALIRNRTESRVMVFIDIRNIIKASIEECEGKFKIDFTNMVDLVVGERQLLGAYVFDGVGRAWNDDDTKKFHKCLEYEGFRVEVRQSCDTEEREQKEVDVAMACMMMHHAYNDNYDVAIVISGDRDFVPAVEHIQMLGKVVEVASFDSSASKHIVRIADRYHNLSKLPIMCIEQYREDEKEDTELSNQLTEDVVTEVQ